jgi:hypothetical protein
MIALPFLRYIVSLFSTKFDFKTGSEYASNIVANTAPSGGLILLDSSIWTIKFGRHCHSCEAKQKI